MKSRYFLVFFLGYTDEGSTREGRIDLVTHGGVFINEQSLREKFVKDMGLSHFYINNVIEISKEDFEHFRKGQAAEGFTITPDDDDDDEIDPNNFLDLLDIS